MPVVHFLIRLFYVRRFLHGRGSTTILLSFCLLFCSALFAGEGEKTPKQKQVYRFDDGTVFTYQRPTAFGWFKRGITNLVPFTRNAFAEDNYGNLALIAASSAVLIYYDQQIYDSVSAFGKRHGISQNSKGSSAFELPEDAGNLMYFIGDGRVPLTISGVMLGMGYYQDDLRMMSTASQLVESLVTCGIVTQIIKQLTGRETPAARTRDGGAWHGFVGPREYLKNRTSYDAFPSGHLATTVAATTVLAENYYEHRTAIYATGAVLSTLLSFQMINNGVHWAGDYPLAIGIGYSIGKLVAANNRNVSEKEDNAMRFFIVPAGDALTVQLSMKL